MKDHESQIKKALLIACVCGVIAIDAQGGTGLKISLGQPFTIAKSEQHLTWGYWNHPILQKCANGDLLLAFSTGEDAFLADQVGTNFYRSVDRGKTWKPEPPWNGGALSPRVRQSFLRFN